MSALRWPQTVQINLSCDIGDETGPVCLGARAHSLYFLVGRQLGYISILNGNGDTALIDRKRAPLPSGSTRQRRARAAESLSALLIAIGLAVVCFARRRLPQSSGRV